MRILAGNGRLTANHAQIIDAECRTVGAAQGAEIYHRATTIKECHRVNITGIQRISHNLSFVVDGCRAAGIATECSQVDQLATAIEKSMGTGIASNLTGGIDRAASALSAAESAQVSDGAVIVKERMSLISEEGARQQVRRAQRCGLEGIAGSIGKIRNGGGVSSTTP